MWECEADIQSGFSNGIHYHGTYQKEGHVSHVNKILLKTQTRRNRDTSWFCSGDFSPHVSPMSDEAAEWRACQPEATTQQTEEPWTERQIPLDGRPQISHSPQLTARPAEKLFGAPTRLPRTSKELHHSSFHYHRHHLHHQQHHRLLHLQKQPLKWNHPRKQQRHPDKTPTQSAEELTTCFNNCNARLSRRELLSHQLQSRHSVSTRTTQAKNHHNSTRGIQASQLKHPEHAKSKSIVTSKQTKHTAQNTTQDTSQDANKDSQHTTGA